LFFPEIYHVYQTQRLASPAGRCTLAHCRVGLVLPPCNPIIPAAVLGSAYWRPTLTIACSPLDAGL